MNAEIAYIPEEAVHNDLHKAVEAQGFIAIAAIKNQLEAALPEDRRAPIRNWLEVLAVMMLCQGHPTRDDRDKAHYSDGSPVFRIVLDGTVADVDVEDYLDSSVDNFDYIGDVAEYLYSSTLNTGYQVEVNDPPVQELREPSQLVQRLRERSSTASVVDGTASVGGAGHGESV
jgi:hypothetical protein